LVLRVSMAGAAAHYSRANCVAASFPSSFVQTAVSHVSSFLRRIEHALQDGHEIFSRAPAMTKLKSRLMSTVRPWPWTVSPPDFN
jgi:hypothetical protein